MDLALFDFDGTITDRELFGEFVRDAVPASRYACGRVVFAPLVAGYRLGLIGPSRMRSLVARFAFAGLAEAAVREAGERFARDTVPARLRPVAMARIGWHRARGDTVAVVSGGFDLYLAPWCRLQGLVPLCSSLEVRDGRLTGRYRGAQCVAGEKVRRVRERFALDAFDAVHAYGDTPEDRAMLDLARHRTYRWQPLG